MPRCTSCSAPLPKSGIICQYCNTRNDIDLQDVQKFTNLRPHQSRDCPLCHTRLHTIDVGEKIPLFIERCQSCYGIFFDVNELEMMIENHVTGSRNVDLIKLAKITENPRHIDVIVYRRCPVCKEHMHRKNFKGRSGVITDVCFEHGVWLDSGELRQIMEWVKTGGLEQAADEPIQHRKKSPLNKETLRHHKQTHRPNQKKKGSLTAEDHLGFDFLDILQDAFFGLRRW